MKKKMLLLGLVLIGQGQAKVHPAKTKMDSNQLERLFEAEENMEKQHYLNHIMGGNPRTWAPTNEIDRVPAPQPPTMNSTVTKIIVNKIMNNEQIPEWYAVSSLKQLNKVRDELFLKNAGANEFLRTPIKATTAQEDKILGLLKAYKKRYSKNHKEYVAKVIAIMKYLPKNDVLLRPLYFQMSGLQMSDLAEAGINFTTYRLSIKDRALFKTTRRKVFNGLTQDYDNLRDRLPRGY